MYAVKSKLITKQNLYRQDDGEFDPLALGILIVVYSIVVAMCSFGSLLMKSLHFFRLRVIVRVSNSIYLSSMMQPTIASIASRYVLALVLVGFLLIGASTSKKEWVVEAQQLLGGRVTWIACFVIMMFSHIAQRSFRKR